VNLQPNQLMERACELNDHATDIYISMKKV